MMQKNTLSVLALLAICLSAPFHAVAQQDRPNIVFILMDNLGYGELGVYGSGILRGAPTPRIDQLASEGMRLLNFDVQVETPVYCRFLFPTIGRRLRRAAMPQPLCHASHRPIHFLTVGVSRVRL